MDTPETHGGRELVELLAEVRRIDVQSRRLVTGFMTGEYRSVFRGSGIEFDEVREYVDGDDPRSVDWNVTARAGRPFVKTYVDERALTVLFLVDLSASMDSSFGEWSTRQVAARVCACLALAAVRNHDHVGMIAFRDDVDTLVSPASGRAHALRIVRDVLALPCRGGSGGLGPALERATRAATRHAIVFVLSDFLGDGWERSLARCARRHDVIAVRLLPPETVPPGLGPVRVREPETGRTVLVDWRSAAVRAAYLGRIADWRRRTARRLRSAQVDLLDVPMPYVRDLDAVARPILRFFRMREQRGTKR